MNVIVYGAFAALAVASAEGVATGQAAPDAGAISEAQVRELAAGMVKAHRGWGPGLNAPGAALTLEETSHEGGVVVYTLYASGLPRDRIYTLIQWPVTSLKPVVALSGVTFDRLGRAICAGKPDTCGDPAKPDDPIDLTSSPAKGEPFRFEVVAEDDETLRAFVKIVPLPIVAEDKGCRLEAVLLMPRAALVLLQATNFPPDVDIAMTSDSEGEVHKTRPRTDAKGAYVSAIMPAKAHLMNGTVKIHIKGPSCDPQISVPWSVERR
jgi:hypothetical protein